jgi:hypothetical protein
MALYGGIGIFYPEKTRFARAGWQVFPNAETVQVKSPQFGLKACWNEFQEIWKWRRDLLNKGWIEFTVEGANPTNGARPNSMPPIERWLAWIEKNRLRQRNKTNNIGNTPRRASVSPASSQAKDPTPETLEPASNGEVPFAGKKGAQHALARLELEEEQAHRRLQLALGRGNPVEIESTQQFWVRCVESLRKLDLSIELTRREAEQQVPLKLAQDVVTFAAQWMRITVAQFLSAESVW